MDYSTLDTAALARLSIQRERGRLSDPQSPFIMAFGRLAASALDVIEGGGGSIQLLAPERDGPIQVALPAGCDNPRVALAIARPELEAILRSWVHPDSPWVDPFTLGWGSALDLASESRKTIIRAQTLPSHPAGFVLLLNIYSQFERSELLAALEKEELLRSVGDGSASLGPARI